MVAGFSTSVSVLKLISVIRSSIRLALDHLGCLEEGAIGFGSFLHDARPVQRRAKVVPAQSGAVTCVGMSPQVQQVTDLGHGLDPGGVQFIQLGDVLKN